MSERALRILAVNWRDLKNPEAGGAETHIHELLERLSIKGHQVTFLAAGFEGAKAEENYNGLRVIRAGGAMTANFALALKARRLLRDESFDVIIEDVNKVPFFLPLFSTLPSLLVVPHLFGSTVFRETNPLFASYVWLMERAVPAVFGRSGVLAISPSTRDDLVSRGMDAGRIQVNFCGFDAEPYNLAEVPAKNAHPTLVHTGRLRKYKGADIVLRSFARIQNEMPEARLEIIGDGPECPQLKKLSASLGLEDSVTFHGFVELPVMVELLHRSHLFLNASPKEGWGLTVVEAGACGVPTVAADSPGLRDSVRHEETGILVPYGDDRAMADAALSLLRDESRRAAMGEAAGHRARSFSWNESANQMEAQLFALLEEGA
jgi:glycosyltransferase involved in cell wall biosynthesis